MALEKLLETHWFALITFLLGVLLGHWTALGRDKRKEFNEAAKPVRDYLLGSINGGNFKPDPGLQGLDLFEQKLGFFQRRSFRAAWQAQIDAYEAGEDHDTIGQIFYTNPEEIRAAELRCLKYTRLR